VPYLSASAVVIHYEEALYQVYGPLPLPLVAVTLTYFFIQALAHAAVRTQAGLYSHIAGRRSVVARSNRN